MSRSRISSKFSGRVDRPLYWMQTLKYTNTELETLVAKTCNSFDHVEQFNSYSSDNLSIICLSTKPLDHSFPSQVNYAPYNLVSKRLTRITSTTTQAWTQPWLPVPTFLTRSTNTRIKKEKLSKTNFTIVTPLVHSDMLSIPVFCCHKIIQKIFRGEETSTDWNILLKYKWGMESIHKQE